MRVIVAGSRYFTNYDLVKEVLDEVDWKILTVLSGNARGIDRLGERWAEENNIEIEKYPAKWTIYGNSAGYRRNVDMSKNADGLIAFWDGSSRGTKHMINIATKAELKVKVVYLKDKNENI